MNQAEPHDLQETIFSLLRACLWGEDRFPFSAQPDTDWAAVRRELRSHAIQNLPLDLLAREDEGQKLAYAHSAIPDVTHWHKLMAEQQALCGLLQDAGIPCAVLKGAGADIYYPKPTLRSMGDIDLLVLPQDFDRAYRLLLDSGAESRGSNYRHERLRRNKIVTELHRTFGTFTDDRLNRLLDEQLFRAITHTRNACIQAFSFPMLPAKENGLVLLTHINIHMESGLGLRQIIDWMMYAEAELSDEIWHREFAPAARQLGLEKLAVTVTRMCQFYLGLSEELTWCLQAEPDLCRKLMARTLKQGNFGKKMPTSYNRTVSILSSIKSIPRFFRVLQRRGRINWSALKRFPWLSPFAWLYQLCRYIKRGLQQKTTPENLKSAWKEEHELDLLLDQLGVTRMKDEH